METAAPARMTREERNQVLEAHIGLVKHIAARLAVLLPRCVELDDLIHDGVLGLIDALERYDPSRGVSFEAYAGRRIRGSILDGLRSRDWVSRGARRRSREVEQAEEKLGHLLGRTPTRRELSRFSGLSNRELERRRAEASEGLLLSLEELRWGPEGTEESLGSALVDPVADVEQEARRRRKKGILLEGLRQLSERERLVLALYYFEELNIREIGEIFGVSEARISQIHTRSLRKLRQKLTAARPDLID